MRTSSKYFFFRSYNGLTHGELGGSYYIGGER